MNRNRISDRAIPGLSLAALWLIALSLSLGWGIRGNWGHEFGAMIPGALAACAACVVSGREDWRKRTLFFTFFGALAWSFGGAMSYGLVLGYTHSGNGLSVFYGFACLFVIGFLWGAIGGAGTALPAYLSRDRLTSFFPLLILIFISWAIQFALNKYEWIDENALDWYDSDWIAALSALTLTLLYALARRRWDDAVKMSLSMSVGWFAAFLTLVVVIGLRMTPPRGDNWAGCLGMTIGLFIYLFHARLASVAFAGLLTGLFAGFGFAFAEFIKLLAISTGVTANWHSVMEQIFGFISGIGIFLCMGYLSTRAPKQNDDPVNDSPQRAWTEPFAFAFILLLVTFLNIRKNVETIWLPNRVIPESMFGHSAEFWFTIAYAILAFTVLKIIDRHLRHPLPIIPSSWLGRGQAFYILFLWWIVIGNLSRYLPFDPQRMITEGVIHVNACICTLIVLFAPREEPFVAEKENTNFTQLFWGVMGLGIVVVILSVWLETFFTMNLFTTPIWGGLPRF